MKTFKNWLATIAALLFSITSHAHDFEVNGIYYDVTSNTEVSVTYRGNYSNNYSNEYSGNVVIPSTVTYSGNEYSVTSIGSSAFYYCSALTSVTIPNSVTSIGDYAFENCDALLSVTIPNSVTNIGIGAFSSCDKLANIITPNTAPYIGMWAFANTKWYNTQPDGCIYLNTWLLGAKNYYTSTLNIKEGTTSIAHKAFAGSRIDIVNIPSSVARVEPNTFGGFWESSSLESEYFDYFWYTQSIHVDENNKHYSSYNGMLYDKEQITLLDCPAGKHIAKLAPTTKKIHKDAFSESDMLYELHLPSGIDTIPSGTFGDMSNGFSKVVCHSQRPPYLYPNSFKHYRALLYVPEESIEEYKSSRWNEFVLQPLQPANHTYKTFIYGRTETTSNNCANVNMTKGETLFAYMPEEDDDNFTVNIYVNSKQAFYFSSYYSNIRLPYSVFQYISPENQNVRISGIENNITVGYAVYTSMYEGLNDWISPFTANSSKSRQTYKFNADYGSTLKFDWATDTEANYDKLYCELDGVNILTKSGKDNGTFTTTLSTSGEHVLEFTYSKDNSTSSGKDQVTISNISISKDIANYNNIKSEITIVDSVYKNELFVKENFNAEKLNYCRTFNDTYWQALYTPFKLPISSLNEEFEVARLNNIHQYDDNNDGIVDRSVLEAFLVKDGNLIPNHPYLIRAKTTGRKIISVENASASVTEEKNVNCSSISHTYNFIGAYKAKNLNNNYALINGEIVKTNKIDALRWYLNIEKKGQENAPLKIQIRVLDNGKDVTGIDEIESTDNSQQSTDIFDLSGRRIQNAQKGIYIQNGKKVFIK